MKHTSIAQAGSCLFVVLSLATVVQSTSPSSAQPRDEAGSAKQRTADVLASEEVIETLRAQLQVLSKSAMNLSLPHGHAAVIFEPTVRVVDLIDFPVRHPKSVLDLDVKKWSWPVVAQSKSASTSNLRLWSDFFATVDFFHHAKFYSIRGSFEGSTRSQFRAESGFEALGQMKSGKLAEIKAKLSILWKGPSESMGRGWRITEIRTDDFVVVETDRPLFSDVLDLALNDTDRVRAQRSKRDEAMIQWILDVGSDKKTLDAAISEIMAKLVDGTAPWHMSHVCVVDIDRDGFDDFYICPSDSMPQFFRNKGDGTFEEVAEKLGLAHEFVEAAIFADFDNDGDSDAFLSFFPKETRYFVNENGRFVERADLLDDPLPHLAIAISTVDYNNDGLLDVYFSRYNGFWLGMIAAGLEKAREQGKHVDPNFFGMTDAESKELYRRLFDKSADPYVNIPGPPNLLFRNMGNGRFAHAKDCKALEQYTQSMSSAWSDIDQDGDMDLYVVTEAAANQLIRNDGSGKFTDITDNETSDVGFGMGLSWGDYDNDGRLDVYVTNMYSKAGLRIADQMKANERIAHSARGNSLLRNGSDGFNRVSGIQPPSILVEAAAFGWGGAFADLNNDGNLDLYSPAGYVTVPRAVAGVGES